VGGELTRTLSLAQQQGESSANDQVRVYIKKRQAKPGKIHIGRRGGGCSRGRKTLAEEPKSHGRKEAKKKRPPRGEVGVMPEGGGRKGVTTFGEVCGMWARGHSHGTKEDKEGLSAWEGKAEGEE